MIEKYNLSITIFPSHYFIPIHYHGLAYQGNDKIYAKQLFGSTQSSYQKPKHDGLINAIQRSITKRKIKEQKKIFKINQIFNLDFSKNYLNT